MIGYVKLLLYFFPIIFKVMNTDLFDQLQKDGLISATSAEKVRTVEAGKLFSLHWELKTILYLGVLLLSGGLGILVYKNIDTIGHQVILLFIAAVCGGCFYYCMKHKPPFSRQKVEAPNGFYDYVLLLGCLLFITFITYLQVQYNVFGTRYGAATFIPLLVLTFSAYYFDHLGILSMAITNLAAWMGITVSPFSVLSMDLSDDRLIYMGVLLGGILVLAAFLSEWKNFKPHFGFTYRNFGMHIFLVACTAGMCTSESLYLAWFLLEILACWYLYMLAIKQRSFYFLLILTLYAYVGLSTVVVRGLADMREGGIELGMLYFVASAIGTAVFLISQNKKMKKA